MAKYTVTRQASLVEDDILEHNVILYISGSTVAVKNPKSGIKGVSKAGANYALSSSFTCSEPYPRYFHGNTINNGGAAFGHSIISTGQTSNAFGTIVTFQIVSGALPAQTNGPTTALSASINWSFKIG